MASVEEVMAALKKRRSETDAVTKKPAVKAKDKAASRKAKSKPKVGEEKLSSIMERRMRQMEEQSYADGGVVRANAGNAKAAQGVGGTINLADGGVVRKPKSAYQKRGGNYRKNGKCSKR